MASETTAAATGAVGKLRRDPFAMLPFCGYNMGDYFAYWLSHRPRARRPRSCRGSSTSTGSARATDGRFLWPGYGENIRVLEWIFRRCEGTADAVEHADRHAPAAGSARPRGPRRSTPARSTSCSAVDLDAWRAEADVDPRALRDLRRAAAAGARGAAGRARVTPVRVRAARPLGSVHAPSPTGACTAPAARLSGARRWSPAGVTPPPAR